jgi:hypothetical protein
MQNGLNLNGIDSSVNKPHILFYNYVWRRWFDFRHRRLIEKIFHLGEVKPLGIEIIQKVGLDERNRCTGETVNRWRYDDNGLQLLSSQPDTSKQIVDYCYFCINKDKGTLVITWATIFPDMSTRKNVHYHHHGEAYKIVEHDGIQDFELISSWIE